MLARMSLIIGILAILAGIGGCKKDSSNPASPAPAPAAQAGITIMITNFTFSPDTLTVPKGTAVTWKNNDGVAHTATSDNGAFDTGNIAAGASGSFTFSTAGTFPYHCTYHSHMLATITVK